MQYSFSKITAARVFAFTFYALLLASHVCASTASVETQATEQAEKTAVDHALRDYNEAFGRGDLSAIRQHCNVPFVSISPQGVKVVPTMSEIEAGYGASCETSESAATRIAHGRSWI